MAPIRPPSATMKDHQLRAFSTVARLGTVRAAARELHLSQSALTKALRELENALGASLLNRSNKGVNLTEAGQALLARVELASAHLELGRAEVQALSGGGGPPVMVGVTPVIAVATLAPVWKTFRQRLPGVPVAFVEGLLPVVIPGLLGGRLDFAVAVATVTELPPDLVFDPFEQVPMAVVGRIGHPLGARAGLPELLKQEWVGNEWKGNPSGRLFQWLAQAGLSRPAQFTQTNAFVLAWTLLRNSDAVGLFPRALLADPLIGETLQEITIRDAPSGLQEAMLGTIGIVRRRHDSLSANAQLLAELFTRYAGPR